MSMTYELFALPMTLLEEIRASAAARSEWLGDPSELDTHSLDETWHALHFLMTGSPDPTDDLLGKVIFGGEPVSDDDMGHGPAHYLTAAEVAESADALRLLDTRQLRARFDRQAMMEFEIHPKTWVNASAADLDELIAAFQKLRDYYTRAAKAGLAMLAWIR